MAASEKPGGSLFAALKGFEPPASQPASPLPPPAAASPMPTGQPLDDRLGGVLERLQKLEGRLDAAAEPSELDDKVAILERRLQETQEKAISSLVMLREREEFHKAAQRELEDRLRTLSPLSRLEELDHKIQGSFEKQLGFIDALETKLEQAVSSRPLEQALAGQAALAAQVDASQSELKDEVSTRMAAVERQMKTVLDAQRRRIEDLESKLQDTGSLRAMTDAQTAQKLLGARLAAAEAELPALKETLAALMEERRSATAEAQALRSETEALRAEQGRLAAAVSTLNEVQRVSLEAAQSAGKEAKDCRAELDEQLRRMLGQLGELADSQRQARSEEASRREEAVGLLAQSVGALRRRLGETEARVAGAEHLVEDIRKNSAAAELDVVRESLDQKVKASADRLARFETEIRGLVLGRVLRLEEQLKKMKKGRD